MNKIIWTCWFQGRDQAPPVVKKCMASWERNNPGWSFRCLDASSIGRYVVLDRVVDLDTQSLTAASLSDVLRILLLSEFGGVWVDATLFCNRPLDQWLPEVMHEGFFAFASPAADRPLSSWFIGAESGNHLIAQWCRETLAYWSDRAASEDYFWFHHLFRDLCEREQPAAAMWARVSKVSANGPHALLVGGRMFRPEAEVSAAIDWETPVFKLTHRLPVAGWPPESLLAHVLDNNRDPSAARDDEAKQVVVTRPRTRPLHFAALKVSTENLGDHIQIIAGLRLMTQLGINPTRWIDRDDEIRSAPGLDQEDGWTGILLNGWFKTNEAEWPPHPKLSPLIIGFHMRPSQCPTLMSDASMDFFRQWEPIGCRDAYTENLLRSRGVEAFTSNCLSLTLPRRFDDPDAQTDVFVVSRDERIKARLPGSIGPYTFVNHYSGSRDFVSNMKRAEELLQIYRTRARLVVTTLLHCALPAVAMGIPVVLFSPLNNDAGHASDMERFSSIVDILPVHSFEDIENVDWNPGAVDVSGLKLQLLDQFYLMAQRWGLGSSPALGPVASPSVLPPP